MSSTNRSNVREAHVGDYYVTPVNRILDFLYEFNKYETILYDDIKILDPTAGGDSKNSMSYPEALQKIGVDRDRIDTIDIRQDSKADLIGDYLNIKLPRHYDVIITNPPFKIAREVIEKALDYDVRDDGFVIMLLRLNYFGGDLRKDMWEKQLPKYSFVHSKRISFTENGKTDSIEYMHCVWQKGYYPDFTQLMVVN